MSVEKSPHEGTISMSYRNKEVLKTSIILGLILVSTLLMTYWIMYSIALEEGLLSLLSLLFWIVFFACVIPTICIVILVAIYETKYVNNFHYTITEDNIIINHGVFTKIRATIPFSRIQNINIVNGVFDRMFKTFTVKIETAGGSGAAQAAQSGRIRP